jgi:hypothetical protein
MAAAGRGISEYRFGEPRSTILIKRTLLAAILVLFPFFAMSSYRAWVQIKSLALAAPDSVLRGGATVQATVESWGRTFVELRIELMQGERAETLAIKEVPRNWDPVFDFRFRRDSLVVEFTPERLAHFEAGPALVRATARGSMQWLREPPPQARERAVVIERPPE